MSSHKKKASLSFKSLPSDNRSFSLTIAPVGFAGELIRRSRVRSVKEGAIRLAVTLKPSNSEVGTSIGHQQVGLVQKKSSNRG